MNNKLKIILILLLAISFPNIVSSQNPISNNVANAIRKGNSSELSKYFNENIQLKIDSKSNIYSKTQAEKILNNFFAGNKPVSFNIDSEKLRGEATVVLGNYTTENSNFRMIYRIVLTDGKNTLTYIEIEAI